MKELDGRMERSRFRRLPPLVASTLRQERKRVECHCKPDDAADLRIASYNIHKAVGTDGRFDPGRIVQVLKEVDAEVVALQEADERFGARAGLLDLHLLKRECDLVPVPMPGVQRGHGWHGNVVLFREGTVTHLSRVVLPGVEPRGALVVDLDLPAGPLRVVAAHLGLLRRSRALQVETLLATIKSGDGRPTFLMGDLNEWRLGERSALQGLASHFGPLHAAIPSFPSRFPVWALDRILGYPAGLITEVELHETALSRVASDHLPLKATVHLPAAGAASQVQRERRRA